MGRWELTLCQRASLQQTWLWEPLHAPSQLLTWWPQLPLRLRTDEAQCC